MTVAARFRSIRRAIAVRWLTDDEGELVGYALGLLEDAFIMRLRLGLLARFPVTAPDDALAALGRDRRVIRGISETRASYVERLIRWLDDRKRQGNPFALMQKLAEYTGPLCSFRTVDVRGNWYSRAANGTESVVFDSGTWVWDEVGPSSSRWSRFWVIIYPNGLWTQGPLTWGDPDTQAWGEAGPGATWGSTALADHVASIRYIVNDWKNGGTRCVNIILAFDPASFDPAAPEPDGLWEHWSKTVDGVRVPARLATARYWDGS